MTSYGDPNVGPWAGKIDCWTVKVEAEWYDADAAILTATIQRMPFAPAWESTVMVQPGRSFRDAIKELMLRVAMDLPVVRGGPDRDDSNAWLDSDEMMMGE